jgi:lysozyme
MKMTDEGLALIKRWEGFRASAYRDAVGVWTIGYGHTSMAGPPTVAAGLKIDEGEAETILRRDVNVFARGVAEAVKVDLTDAQFSALVSFSFNDFDAVPRRLQLWTKAGGRVLPGLVKRRADEAALFASGGKADVVAPAPVDKIEGKPPAQSKTILAASFALLLSLLQAWLSLSLTFSAVAVLLLMAAALVFIIYERWKKLKQEGV